MAPLPGLRAHPRHDPKWGAWVIQDQSDIADYPIELLDARVILQLLEPAELSQLPNSADGTGNWAEIMENHRTNFNEAKFRADTENLGVTQSDLLTQRMIAEIEAQVGMGDAVDWLRRHSPGIAHQQLTFFTEHKNLIEDMTTVLFAKHLDDWPLDFSFPFGRMPIFLMDPHDDAGPDSPGISDPFHQLPTHWERVIAGQAALGQEGCWHNWPLNAYVPILDNADAVMDPGEGDISLGQFECDTFVTANGFVDRPCTNPVDYTTTVDPLGTQRINGSTGTPFPLPGGLAGSMRTVVESDWHNPIHGVIGGSFGPPSTTAGTMVFWVFHTYASTVTLSNWRHAQKRDMPLPNRTPLCDANGPYVVECQGATTDVQLDGTGSSDPDGDPLSFTWTDSFGVAVGPTPTVQFSGLGTFPVDLEVSDGMDAASCSAEVTIEDTTPPELSVSVEPAVLWPPNHKLVTVTATVTAIDVCDANPTIQLVSITSNEPDNGLGDGNTSDDIQGADFGTADVSFQLRAERSGTGNGRVYTISYAATDGSREHYD